MKNLAVKIAARFFVLPILLSILFNVIDFHSYEKKTSPFNHSKGFLMIS